MKARGPYRDGSVHVLARQCETCIFRPGNVMNLRRGRVADLVRASLAKDTAIICHDTYKGDRAVCRGFYDRFAARVFPLRFARMLGLIVEQEPPGGAQHGNG